MKAIVESIKPSSQSVANIATLILADGGTATITVPLDIAVGDVLEVAQRRMFGKLRWAVVQ